MSKPIVLIPGTVHPRTKERVHSQFDVIEIPRNDIALLPEQQRSQIIGIASMCVIDADFIQALPNLEIIAHFGVGYDVVDAKFAAKNEVMVSNTPDVLSDEVADITVGLLLNTLRELPKAENYLRSGKWEKEGNYPLTKLTLRDRKVGIYGLGRIGLEIAKRLEGFGVDIHYHSRNAKPDIEYEYHKTLLGLAQSVDTLISIVPGSPQTEHSVDAAILTALGSDGVFINVGRGSVVVEDDLVSALKSGTIAAAGLDVFENEPIVSQALLDLDNVSLLPHVASASHHTRNAMAELQVQNLINWFDKGHAVSPVIETRDLSRKI